MSLLYNRNATVNQFILINFKNKVDLQSPLVYSASVVIVSRQERRTMTDSTALRQLIDSKGLKLSYVAEYIGLSAYGFSLKLNNKSEFRTGEIARLCELLGISAKQRDKIFFARKVDLQST